MAPQSVTQIITLVVFLLTSGILPALFWLWFWLREDRRRPEPRWLIALVFLLGSLMVVPSYFLEKLVLGRIPFVAGQISLTIILIWAAIEEILKYAAAYFGAFRSRYFDEPIDAMIYLITAALGFAAVENTLFIFNILHQEGAGNLNFLITGNFRFIGATVIHIVASALVGVTVGLSFYQPRWRKVLFASAGILLAIALHALFNYSIIYGGEDQIMNIFIGLWFSAILIIFLFEKVKKSIIKIKAYK